MESVELEKKDILDANDDGQPSPLFFKRPSSFLDLDHSFWI
jgi:hypothetical protein